MSESTEMESADHFLDTKKMVPSGSGAEIKRRNPVSEFEQKLTESERLSKVRAWQRLNDADNTIYVDNVPRIIHQPRRDSRLWKYGCLALLAAGFVLFGIFVWPK